MPKIVFTIIFIYLFLPIGTLAGRHGKTERIVVHVIAADEVHQLVGRSVAAHNKKR